MDSMCSSGIPCSAPRSIDRVKVPAVYELRPGTFHYQGLLPWAIHQPIVIAPNVYSATKFCRRKLTGKEMMHVLDVPDWVGQLLQSNEIKELITDRKFLAMKCACLVIDGILALFAKPTLVSHPGEVCNTSDTWNKDERKVDQNSLIFEQEAELKRIQKVTKSDDAAIPEHLWNDRIMVHGLESSNHSMKKVLDCIRGGALRWWRQRTLQDFLRWLNKSMHILLNLTWSPVTSCGTSRPQSIGLRAVIVLVDAQIPASGTGIPVPDLYFGIGRLITSKPYVKD
jgi:hypothetical protein